MTQVKICGLNDAASFDAAVAAGADYVGFVFFPPSPRCVTPAKAALLSARHPGGPRRVGLFVSPSDEAVAEALASLSLDVLQLYTSAARAAALRARFGVAVWHAVGVSAVADLPHDVAGSDGLLIDAKSPPEATRPGGNAVPVDWSILSGWTPPCLWALAGGLTPANVATALRVTTAPIVDVSSGVEKAPGVKDPRLIEGFITAARAA